MLKKENIRLDYMNMEDLNKLVDLRNNNWEYFLNEMPLRKECQWDFYQNMCADETRQIFGIYVDDDFKGSIGFKNLDRRNQSAEYGNLIISDEQRGEGIGTTASKLLLEFMFYQMNLMRVYLEVVSDNLEAIKLYDNIGFMKEGTKRSACYSFGQFRDVIMMSMLKNELKMEKVK